MDANGVTLPVMDALSQLSVQLHGLAVFVVIFACFTILALFAIGTLAFARIR